LSLYNIIVSKLHELIQWFWEISSCRPYQNRTVHPRIRWYGIANFLNLIMHVHHAIWWM